MINSLLLPFKKQRDYWRMPDGTDALRINRAESTLHPTRLAE